MYIHIYTYCPVCIYIYIYIMWMDLWPGESWCYWTYGPASVTLGNQLPVSDWNVATGIEPQSHFQKEVTGHLTSSWSFLWIYVGMKMINHPFGNGLPNYLWWFGGRFIIVITTLYPITPIEHQFSLFQAHSKTKLVT